MLHEVSQSHEGPQRNAATAIWLAHCNLFSLTKIKAVMTEDKASNIIIGAAIEVHKFLGPGLLESAYQECLYYELRKRRLTVRQQVPMPVVYKEIHLDRGYRMDLLVENKVVVELKTVECFTDVHIAQLLTYLRLGNYKLGLLINFHTSLLRDGIKRYIN